MAGSEPTELGGLPLVREAFSRTIRLVTSARLRDSVMKPLCDDDAELALLAEIEGATSGRQIVQERGKASLSSAELVHGVPHAHFINASFAYSKPREPMRFNPADRGAWYSALDVRTCLAEVSHHLTQALNDAGSFEAVVEYSEMFASMSGVFLDLRENQTHDCLHPDPAQGYVAGNVLAADARAAGHNGIIYPSVRDEAGTCIVALWPNVVQSVTQGGIWRLTWSGSPKCAIEQVQ